MNQPRRSFLGGCVAAALGLLCIKPAKASGGCEARRDNSAFIADFHSQLRAGKHSPMFSYWLDQESGYTLYTGTCFFPYIDKVNPGWVRWHNPHTGKLPLTAIACHPSIACLMPNS